MRRVVPLAFLCAFLAAPIVHAQSSVDQAKTLFSAGAQAYERGDFLAAIQAFEEAEKRAPRPAILFSIAQAHRRQYYNDTTNTDHLRAAVAKYREYLAAAPDGSRKSDASQALAELGPAADRLAASTDVRPALKQPARISINSTGTPNVHISLDGAPPVETPLIKAVTEGKHTVVVSAEGFVDETHEIIAVDGSLVAQDFPLKDKPGLLTIKTLDGARVEVDGRVTGNTPLLQPIAVPPGSHLVSVAKNGHDAAIVEVDLDRGQAKTLQMPMPTSTQRKVATGFLLAGAVGAVAGGVFVALALERQSFAKSILDRSATQNITGQDLESYQSAVSTRKTWQGGAFIGFSAGVALSVTGLLLYAFDQPSLSGPTIREKSDKSNKPDAPKKLEPTEIGLWPAIGPGLLGASLTGHF